MAELERGPGEREGDIHWYDLPDDEAEEDLVPDEESLEGSVPGWVLAYEARRDGELGVAR